MQAGSGLGIVLTRVLFPATIVLEPKFLYCLDFIFRGSVVDWQWTRNRVRRSHVLSACLL